MTEPFEGMLFEGLLDDAAVFPPGNASVRDALEAHVARRLDPAAVLVGPLVLSTTHLELLAASLDEELTSAKLEASPLALNLVVRELEEVPRAIATVNADPRLSLTGLEVTPPSHTTMTSALTALTAYGLPDAQVFVECPWGMRLPRDVVEIAEAGYHVKLRTGGTTLGAFPSEPELAEAIVLAVSHQVAFKATAGLHRAVRHRDGSTGFEHHGFLNVLLAASTADEGVEVVRSALAEQDARTVAHAVLALGADGLHGVRSTRFLSFGTCDVDEPARDLISLGLLAGEGVNV